jgi:hypothetical protein
MSLKDRIEALGEEISSDLKEILHELAVFVGAAAPVAEEIEAVVAPEDVAATKVAEEVAKAIEQETK